MRIEQSILHIYPVGQKFRRNRSISHGLGDTFNLRFIILVKNSKIQNGRHFWKEEKFFEDLAEYLADIPCGPKISPKSLYLAWFRRYKQFAFYHFCQKFANSK